MDKPDSKQYLLENGSSEGKNFSPVINPVMNQAIGAEKKGQFHWFTDAVDYVGKKASDSLFDIKVALESTRKLFSKRVLVFSIVMLLVLMTNATIFSFLPSSKKEYPSVLNFGDMMFDRGVRNIIENRKRDPFEYIKKDKSILEKYDMVIANLEGPIVQMDRGICQQKAYNFQFASDTPDRIKGVGIKMVNLANNHTYDCFKQGFLSTRDALDKAGILHIGDIQIEKSYTIKEIDKKKVAFVGIDQTVMMIPVSKFYSLVQKLKSENDYVVVNIHWGTEYLLGTSDIQKEIGHKLVDSGADVVFGSHPHVVEPVEVYKNGVIFYSLGNFVFDQDFGDTTVGIGAGVEFQGDKGKEKKIVTIYPFNIKKFAPDFMKGLERQNFCQKFLSDIENTDCTFTVQN